MRLRRVSILMVPAAAALVLASGCAATQASSAKREPLAVPPAPPRVIVPAPAPAQESTLPEPELVPALPRPTRSSPREPARSEPKAPGAPVDPAATAPPPAAAPATPGAAGGAAPPASELRTVEAPDDSKASRLVRDTLDRAGRTLNGIDYARLPKPSQLQYDMAKRFIEQSEEALRTRNFTAAQLMAEKADTIAKELSGR